jgi:hypothetical protein
MEEKGKHGEHGDGSGASSLCEKKHQNRPRPVKKSKILEIKNDV